MIYSPLTDQAPWITHKAIAFLEDWLDKTMSVHEWGSGGSTLFFAKRCAKVTTVEHNSNWLAKTQKEITRLKLSNTCMYHVGAGKIVNGTNNNPMDFLSSMVRGSMKNYCQKIEGEHDLVMVDGRSRPGCVITGFKHVKMGGFLILDNAERAHYGKAIVHMNKLGWKVYEWRGLAPYSDGSELSTMGWQRI